MAICYNLFLIVLLACLGLSLCAPAGSSSQKIVRRNRRNLIDDIHPRNVVPSIARSKRMASARRVKRSATEKELQDPNNCIHKCWDEDDERTEQVQTSFENKAHVAEHAGEDEASQKTLMSGVLNNLGSFMSDSCQAAKKTKQCFQSCPNSQLKDVAIADYYAEDIACEPDKNFGGYTNYRMAVFCLNNTMVYSHEYCAKQCNGEVKDLREAIELGIDRNESDSSTVAYESNVEKIKQQCKITSCTRDCSKSYLMKRCGQKGYDLYSRQLALEPRSTLTILQKLNAISSVPSECNSFK